MVTQAYWQFNTIRHFVQDINLNIRNVTNWGSYDITSNTMDSIWESEWSSPELNVISKQKLYPYSALRSIQGQPQEATEVSWQPNGIEIP